MRHFILKRLEDVSGVSGTGIVAEGTEFHNGQVALSWLGFHHTIEISPSVKDVVQIHGHGGKTVLEWLPRASWSGYPDPTDPDNFWIDDITGEQVNAITGERTKI